MMNRAWGEEYRTTAVCIDSYINGVPVGCFYNPYLEEDRPFQSTTQFLLEMERALDVMDFPKAFTTTRAFTPPPPQSTGPPGREMRMGRRATFSLKILFRQNASWQGSVTWLEGRREQSFRSVLELLLLMDSALRADAKAS